MRDFKGMKRQRGRNRGGGGQGGQSSGKPQHNINRAFDSNGPDNMKVRGNAQHVYEKYQALARDAQSAGDRVLAENHLQHAEHYFRTLRAIQPNRPASEIVSRDTFASGYDIDFEDEAVESAMEEADAQAAARATEAANAPPAPAGEGEGVGEGQGQGFGLGQGQGQGQGQGGQAFRDRGRGEWRDRNDRPQGERFGGDRPQGDRSQNDRSQNGDRSQGEFRDRPPQGDRQPQGERAQGEFRDRGDRPRFRDRDDRYRDRQDRPAQDRAAQDRPTQERPAQDRAEPRAEGDRPREDRFERPREEGRRDRFRERDERRFEPREDVPAAEGVREAPPVLRSEDGGASDLPAFLQAPAPVAPAATEDGEPRRRPRARRPRAEDGPAPTSAPEVEEA